MADKISKEATKNNYIDMTVSFSKTEIQSIIKQIENNGFTEFKGKWEKWDVQEGTEDMRQLYQDSDLDTVDKTVHYLK